MTDSPSRRAGPTGERGVLRTSASGLPRNHHGDRVAPITPDGRPYQFCWTDAERGELVYAETAEDLLAMWLPGYGDADAEQRAMLRAEHAARIRDELAAELVDQADAQGQVLTADERAVALADLAEMPDIDRWDPVVPLVLLEGMYRPYTNRRPPVSGIDGDVQEPSNVIWLRHAHPDSYLRSLAAAGAADLAAYTSHA